jgi:hypothetical protein
MSDKPFAGLVIAAVAAPVAILCCLGAVFLGSLLGGMVGWLSGLNLVAGAGLVLVASLLAYGFVLWRRVRRRHEDA